MMESNKRYFKVLTRYADHDGWVTIGEVYQMEEESSNGRSVWLFNEDLDTVEWFYRKDVEEVFDYGK